MYCQVCHSVARFQTEDVTEKPVHENGTESNKSLNNTVGRLCSKFKYNGTTMTLTTRVNIIICICNTG